MLAKDLLTQARYILSDTSKDRWTDTRLLALLYTGIVDIAKKTTIFVETKIILLSDTVVDINLSSISTKIVRAEYMDEPVPFYTFEEMDTKFGKGWQKEEGDKLKALVYDKQRNSVLKTYPIVKNAQNDNIEYSSSFGIITDISYSDIQPVMFDHYGDIAGLPNEALVKIYYVRRHERLTDINQELFIDELCEDPLIHYVAGRALRDNQDTLNSNMSKNELGYYYELIEEYNIEKSENYIRGPREVPYRPLG